MDQKVSKVISLLPQNKQIFVTYAVFQTVQQVPNPIRNQYFDRNIQQIAKLFVQGFYKDKDIEEINKDDIVIDFMDWLEGGTTKFKMQTENKPKTDAVKVQSMQQHLQQNNQVKNQPPNNPPTNNTERIPITAHNQTTPKLSPRPQLLRQPPNFNLQQPVQNYPPKNTYIQQNYQPQGRPNVVKYTSKEPTQPIVQPQPNNDSRTSLTPNKNPPPPTQNNNYNQTIPTIQTVQNQLNYRQMLKRQQQKQSYSWIDNLSRCLTYPQKRFYLMPQMMPKRKF